MRNTPLQPLSASAQLSLSRGEAAVVKTIVIGCGIWAGGGSLNARRARMLVIARSREGLPVEASSAGFAIAPEPVIQKRTATLKSPGRASG